MGFTSYPTLCYIAMLFIEASVSINGKSTSYNLISYSRIHVIKTLTKKPATTSTDENHLCVQQKNNKDEFKCKGEILDTNGKHIGNNGNGDEDGDDTMLHRVIESSHNWKLQFDRNTRGIDVVVVFAKVSIEILFIITVYCI